MNLKQLFSIPLGIQCSLMLDDLDNMLESWESLFNSVLDEHCPSREKRVKRLQQVPWMSKPIFDQVHLRDSYLKAARISGSSHDCKKYTVERNKAVKVIRNAKREYFNDAFDTNRDNSKSMWETLKPLAGGTKNVHSVKSQSAILSKFPLSSRPREA